MRLLRPLTACIAGIFCLGIFAFSILAAEAEGASPPTLPRATQAWRSTSDEKLLCIEGDRLWSPSQSAVRVLVIEHHDPQAWTVREEDTLKTWKVSQQAKALRTEVLGKITEYRKLHSVPAACAFRVVTVGQPREISKERAESVSHEIHERMLKDQKAMQAGIIGPTSPVIIENRKYLERLIRELGWIDLQRFGPEGSGNAIVLAQHSEDLPLMVAVLPKVEKEYKNGGGDPIMYAILYDALQRHLGRKQRFGTQMGLDSAGNPMVLPLEDASKVEQFRKEIGLPPLAEYLKLASEGLYSGKAVRMPRDDE